MKKHLKIIIPIALAVVIVSAGLTSYFYKPFYYRFWSKDDSIVVTTLVTVNGKTAYLDDGSLKITDADGKNISAKADTGDERNIITVANAESDSYTISFSINSVEFDYSVNLLTSWDIHRATLNISIEPTLSNVSYIIERSSLDKEGERMVGNSMYETEMNTNDVNHIG